MFGQQSYSSQEYWALKFGVPPCPVLRAVSLGHQQKSQPFGEFGILDAQSFDVSTCLQFLVFPCYVPAPSGNFLFNFPRTDYKSSLRSHWLESIQISDLCFRVSPGHFSSPLSLSFIPVASSNRSLLGLQSQDQRQGQLFPVQSIYNVEHLVYLKIVND